MLKIWTLFIIGTVALGTLQAQEVWSLSDCFEYALANNRNLKIEANTLGIEQQELKRIKGNYLPALSAGSTVSMNYGRSIDPETNTYSFNSNYSNSLSASASFQIFDGLKRINELRAQKFALYVGEENYSAEENALLMRVASAYFDLLLTEKLWLSSKEQLVLSAKELSRIEKLIEVGRAAVSDRVELESQLSSAEYSEVMTRNNRELALHHLCALLNLKDRSIVVQNEMSDEQLISLHPKEAFEIFKLASENLPRIKALQNQVISMEYDLKAVKGLNIPTLSLYGGISTGYNDQNKNSYVTQLDDNMSEYVQASLQIPIFSRLYNRTSIQKSKLRLNSQQLRLEQELEDVYNAIEKVCLDYNASLEQLQSARKKQALAETAYTEMQRKFELGLANTTELFSAQTRLTISTDEISRAEVNLEIQKLWVRYYQTGTVQF